MIHPIEALVLSGMWRRRTVAQETDKQHSCFAHCLFSGTLGQIHGGREVGESCGTDE